jgi:hypothetical protein
MRLRTTIGHSLTTPAHGRHKPKTIQTRTGQSADAQEEPMSLFTKSEEEKRVANNRRILKERPHLRSITPEWNFQEFELYAHSLKNDPAARNSLGLVLGWKTDQFPYSRLWLYFTGATTEEMIEVRSAWENGCNWEVVESLYHEKCSLKRPLHLKSLIVVNTNDSVAPLVITEYRLSDDKQLLYNILESVRKSAPRCSIS